ncbi:gliding motility-associated C-terminal domain-containing protein [Mucilaginibacter sp. BJC16-A38]|uniref:gliding motility-associated C-terminal domain-containing protein n=1 Tax=Mucilaginibacter phenanthrenivorans TaxID=1234842 RepID=UPI0021583809|nr:gliding motility-associated C-terminal domain-containing protein [Mucilaginibacter phenanthrenivorans]MCR8557096.1 gliding motility-associated C-terminal domain-containing protein [Mucilaginibacter phenanthrenivorans]
MFKHLVIIFLFISINAYSQVPNVGFEDGSFSGWKCYIGSVDPDGTVHVNPTPAVYNRQTLIGKESANTLDPYGKFPILCPNGSKYSIRLGNSDTGKQAERVTYTFTVPNQPSYSILFDYAVVLDNFRHADYQQPKFVAQVYDITSGKYLDCPSFDFVASSSLPGFKLSADTGARNSSIYYKDWSTASIDLSNHIGEVIRLEFTTNDCTKGQHFGYAYLDINENNGVSIAGNAYCAGQTYMTLYAPNGFQTYQWYNADMTQKVGTGQSLTISPPPPDGTAYTLQIFPYDGLGCIDILHTTVNKIDEGFRLSVLDTVFGCPGIGADLTEPKVTAGTSVGATLSYYTDPLGSSYLYKPDRITVSGKYYIQGMNAEGCMNILPVNVVIATPQLVVVDPPTVVFPTTVDLTKTFVHLPRLTYSYYSDAEATKPVSNYTAIRYAGVFYIKAESDYGCSTIQRVDVDIQPPPPYTIVAPNTFTPNNDGINDNFSLTIDGQLTFKSVRIFNRYGKLVFTAKSAADYWDGNYNRQNLPVGVYYWVFDGVDNYRQTKVSKAASIMLLR